MKKLFQLSALALGLLPAATTQAWTYKDGDVLLVFRESALPTYPSPFKDVEFDIGSVTNFLGKTNGYTTTVSGFSLSPVTAVYGSDLTGVSVILVATTSPTNATPTAYFSAALPQTFWFNGVEPFNTAYSVSPAGWQGFWSTINSLGTRPLLYSSASQQAATSYSLAATDVRSYDAIVASGASGVSGYPEAVATNGVVTQDWLPEFGGAAPFNVEGVAPGSFGFLAVTTNSATPVRDTYLGTFKITAPGVLTFTAGPPQPHVTAITRSGNTSTVSFSTVLSGSYGLVYTNVLGGSVTNWPAVGGSLVGDGNTNSLTHTASGSAGFYGVVRAP
ncbi:MAG TPA: hypothetical protein VK742_14835 [Candidatus Sulfotelmatobacter sp.]|jgi:hypothetical protein|nr:hypothetical protein [Candidatus Sulfotelmatobacter sp.]